jgi:hypothetical protein
VEPSSGFHPVTWERVIREPYYIKKTTTNHGSENSFKEDFMKNNMYQRGKMTMVK